MGNRLGWLVGMMVLLMVVTSGCSRLKKGNSAGALPSGDLVQSDPIRYEVAIYYLPEPTANPEVVFRDALKQLAPFWKSMKKADPKQDAFVYLANMVTDVANQYRPPSLEALRYFGRGLSREQAEQLQSCAAVFVVDFAYPPGQRFQAVRSVNEVMEQVARTTGGLVWDESTREVFTPDAWQKSRRDSWTEEFPEMATQITIHSYKDKDYVRAVTLGMSKFGLPELVIENTAWSNRKGVGNLINGLAQSLVENGTLSPAGERRVVLKELKNAAYREDQIKGLGAKATGEGCVTLRWGQRQEGDADNRLLQIGFDRYDGPDEHARQDALFSDMYGSTESIKATKHDDELLAASQRAREQLPALRESFLKGFTPGEYLVLKAPFKTTKGGNEWMWVEVTEWKDGHIKGLLKNEPFYIPTLHAGQVVEVDEKNVFDYILHRADGSQEGNETGAIIEKRQGEVREKP